MGVIVLFWNWKNKNLTKRIVTRTLLIHVGKVYIVTRASSLNRVCTMRVRARGRASGSVTKECACKKKRTFNDELCDSRRRQERLIHLYEQDINCSVNRDTSAGLSQRDPLLPSLTRCHRYHSFFSVIYFATSIFSGSQLNVTLSIIGNRAFDAGVTMRSEPELLSQNLPGYSVSQNQQTGDLLNMSAKVVFKVRLVRAGEFKNWRGKTERGGILLL